MEAQCTKCEALFEVNGEKVPDQPHVPPETKDDSQRVLRFKHFRIIRVVFYGLTSRASCYCF